MAFIPNPPVPFIHPINYLAPGTMIQVSGRTPQHAKWFAINLQCGPSTNPRDDIALYVSPRFEGNLSKVIRNSLTNQQWGFEECFGHFPFRLDGQPFEIQILCEEERFKIAVNGQHYTDFGYRLPWQRINTLAVDGDVELLCVRLESHSPHAGDSSQHHPNYSATTPSFSSRLTVDSVPTPGNKSPLLSASKRDLGSASVGFLAGVAMGYGASRLLYPGHGRNFGRHSNDEKRKKLKKHGKFGHKPSKSSHKKWSSSSSSSSSSGSE